MMQRYVSQCLFVFLMIAALFAAAHAQSSVIGENCDLNVFGEKEAASFLTFDHELRDALAKRDRAKLALLVEYPLRVNDAAGSYYIHDAASLDGHFEGVFTPKIRRAIANQPLATINCYGFGIEYGNGDVWVDPTEYGYAVRAVNLASGSRAHPPVGHTEFACRTEKHRVIVDIAPDGVPRLRFWNKPRSLTQSPDVQIESGKSAIEGTGYCSHPVWTFTNAQSKFEVSGLGCFPDSNQPPRTATGQLSIWSGPKEQEWWWCF